MLHKWIVGGVLGLAVVFGGTAVDAGGSDAPWSGQVVAVYDGDTLLVRHGRAREMIRLHGVDAPEWEQRYGPSAGNFVANLLLYETVRVRPVVKDFYDRTVAVVELDDGRSLNELLLDRGYAWVYRSYVWGSLRYAYLDRERVARDDHRGLWHDANPTPPWRWRQWY
ncbi:MAG: thermonuclease family protein [Planctomycetes bacterium]|nr:thermonuclease family protein [Planctomycetota bacterium]